MSVFSNTSQDFPALRAQYAKAGLGLVGERTPLEVLRETPGAAARAVATLTPEKLRRPEAPGKWSVAMVLRHLADTDVVWGWRMRLILAQDRPPITGFDQDLWADRLDYADSDPAESLEAFTILRRHNPPPPVRRTRSAPLESDRSRQEGDRVIDERASYCGADVFDARVFRV